MQVVETLLILFILSAYISPTLNHMIGRSVGEFYSNTRNFINRIEVPFNPNIEATMLAIGSVIFYVSRVKKFRSQPFACEDNKIAFGTLVLGVLLGLLVDPYHQ